MWHPLQQSLLPNGILHHASIHRSKDENANANEFKKRGKSDFRMKRVNLDFGKTGRGEEDPDWVGQRCDSGPIPQRPRQREQHMPKTIMLLEIDSVLFSSINDE